MMQKNDKYINQFGRSMVEMIGVLTIVGVLSIGGIAGYLKASEMLRTSKLKDDLSHLIANIRTVYFTQDSYANISAENIIRVGIVPDHMISDDNSSIINRLGGTVSLSPAKITDDENGAFILIFNGLDSKTCNALIIENWGSDVQTGFIGMSISKTGDMTAQTSGLVDAEFATTETVFHSRDLPMALISQSYDACNCTDQTLCSIAWKFI